MKTIECFFYSSGYKLEAALFLPDGCKDGERRPCIIANSGYMGLKEIYPSLFARAMTQRGYIVFGFDYRGFKKSEGPAGVCKLEEQVEDIRNAITYVQTLGEVDAARIGMIGWAMAAGLAVAAAAKEPAVRAVAGLNGFYHGERWMKAVHPYAKFVKLKNEARQERARLVQEGIRKYSNPFYFYPLDPETEAVVLEKLYTVDGYGQEISLEFGQSLFEFDAQKFAGALRAPVLVAHGKYNLLHPIEESLLFFEALRDGASGEKELFLIEGKHNDFMTDEHPVFINLCEKLDAFFKTRL